MLVVFKPKLGRVLFLDPNSNTSVPAHVRAVLLPAISDILGVAHLEIETPKKSNQRDSWNCGVFILKYIDQVSQNLPLVFEFDPAFYRNELLQRLWMSSEEFIQTLQYPVNFN